jgi:RNA polymerase sigma-70 factor (ECF subfamily)
LPGPTLAAERENVDDDRELVSRARGGDRQAFEDIVRSYQRKVYGLALRMTRKHEIADEITQETFIRAYTHLNRFEVGKPLMPWLARIATNLSLNHLSSAPVRREAPLGDVEDQAPRLEAAEPQSDPLRVLLTTEFTRALGRAVAELPTEQKSVFLLKVQQDMSYEEIASTLEISIGTVMSRLSRARAKLRSRLKDFV